MSCSNWHSCSSGRSQIEQAPDAKTPAKAVSILATLWAVICLLAPGAWRQSRRWRIAGELREAVRSAMPASA